MRLTTSLLFGAAGLAWTAGQAILPDTGLETAERYDAVVAERGLEGASGGLLILAGGLLVLGAIALARRVPCSRLLTLGIALTALGGLWLVGGRGVFNLTFYRLTGDGVPRDVALKILDSSTGAGFVPLLLMLPALLVGPVLLATGLRKSHGAGWAPLACWVIGIGVFLATEFTVKAGEIAGIGLASVGLLLIGRAVDTSTDPTSTTHPEASAPARR